MVRILIFSIFFFLPNEWGNLRGRIGICDLGRDTNFELTNIGIYVYFCLSGSVHMWLLLNLCLLFCFADWVLKDRCIQFVSLVVVSFLLLLLTLNHTYELMLIVICECKIECADWMEWRNARVWFTSCICLVNCYHLFEWECLFNELCWNFYLTDYMCIC